MMGVVKGTKAVSGGPEGLAQYYLWGEGREGSGGAQ